MRTNSSNRKPHLDGNESTFRMLKTPFSFFPFFSFLFFFLPDFFFVNPRTLCVITESPDRLFFLVAAELFAYQIAPKRRKNLGMF